MNRSTLKAFLRRSFLVPLFAVSPFLMAGSCPKEESVNFVGASEKAHAALQNVKADRFLNSPEEIQAWFDDPKVSLVIIAVDLLPSDTIHHFGYTEYYDKNKAPDNAYSYLSNYYEASPHHADASVHHFSVTFNGKTYESSEAAYQAQKLIGTPDFDLFTTLAADEAKKLARDKAPNKRVPDDVMKAIVGAKFTQNNYLAAQLLDTKKAFMIEETTLWADLRWGMVRAKKGGRDYLIGENKLGKILGQVREELN